MKRNFDLIRLLLLDAEGVSSVDLSDFGDNEVRYHQALVVEAGLVEGTIKESSRTYSEVPDLVVIRKLTWEGHEFLDKARDPSIWRKSKDYVRDKGLELTLDALKAAMTTIVSRLL